MIATCTRVVLHATESQNKSLVTKCFPNSLFAPCYLAHFFSVATGIMWNYHQLGRAWDILRVLSPYRGRNGDFSTWRKEVCALIIHMGNKESQDMSGQRPKAGEARINCGDGIGKPARVPRVSPSQALTTYAHVTTPTSSCVGSVT